MTTLRSKRKKSVDSNPGDLCLGPLLSTEGPSPWPHQPYSHFGVMTWFYQNCLFLFHFIRFCLIDFEFLKS